MSDSEKTRSRPNFIWRTFGWLLGALSLLNLIEDLDLVKLYGSIETWVMAYGMLVSSVGHFLFGWIEWRWIRVDEYEHHLVVLAGLMSGVIGRAYYPTLIRLEDPDPVGNAIGFAFAVLLFVLIAVLLIPSPESLWIGVGLVFTICLGGLMRGEKGESPDVDPIDFAKELAVVGSLFLAAIAVNYLVFKP